MNPFRTPGRALAALTLAAATLLATAPMAAAHAGIESSSPRNGAQLQSAPKAVTLTFAESIKLDGKGSRLIDQTGATVPAVVKAKGHKVTLTPASPLPAGRYAAAWHLISTDGDAVEGAITFTIATANPRGPAQVLTTKPAVPATLNGTLPGSRTLALLTKGTTGDVEWTTAKLPEAVTWIATGNGKKATATGVLPWAGVWSFTATVTDANSNVLVVKGTVTLKG
jgi:methionine-rich copper-binding protein CopC